MRVTDDETAMVEALLLALARRGIDAVFMAQDRDDHIALLHNNDAAVYRLSDGVASQYWRGAGETIN